MRSARLRLSVVDAEDRDGEGLRVDVGDPARGEATALPATSASVGPRARPACRFAG